MSIFATVNAKLIEMFGDMMGMNAPTWNSAKPQEEVKNPDFNEMYKKYSDFD